MRRVRILVVGAATSLLLVATGAQAQIPDHLKCYKVKDPLNLKGIVELPAPQFPLDGECKISRAKFFCVPSGKIVVSAEDGDLPIVLLPLTGPNPGDRICYKVRCPAPFPPGTLVTDQFGTRVVTEFKTQMLCTPAVKGFAPPRFVDNGDGTVTDNQTRLQWEKKVAGSGCLHCVDDQKTWANAMSEWLSQVNGYSANGNAQQGLGGRSDWRLPTSAELQTILLEPDPCDTSPCIDATFGPTSPSGYWSSSTNTNATGDAWAVTFFDGGVGSLGKTDNIYVRAVRGGS